MTKDKPQRERPSRGVEHLKSSAGKVAFHNALAMYDMMATKAHMRPEKELLEYGYPAEEGKEILVYEGYSSKDAEGLSILRSSTSHGMSLLKALNAITVLIKGNHYRPSIYLLHYRPTTEHFEAFKGRSWAMERKMAPTTYDTLINDIVRLRTDLAEAVRRIEILEESLNNERHELRRSEALPSLRTPGRGDAKDSPAGS